jgi:hypothetical protein
MRAGFGLANMVFDNVVGDLLTSQRIEDMARQVGPRDSCARLAVAPPAARLADPGCPR